MSAAARRHRWREVDRTLVNEPGCVGVVIAAENYVSRQRRRAVAASVVRCGAKAVEVDPFRRPVTPPA